MKILIHANLQNIFNQNRINFIVAVKKNALVVVYVLLPATKMQLLWKMERLIFYVMIFVMVLETVFRPALQVQCIRLIGLRPHVTQKQMNLQRKQQ